MRSDNLVKKANEIVNVTGCAVILEVLPTWVNGVPRYYNSNNFKILTKYQEIITIIPRTRSPISTYHFLQYIATPSKKPRSDNDTTDINIKISAAYATLDVANDSARINCKRSCNWWVHARYVGIHYENTEKGEKS